MATRTPLKQTDSYCKDAQLQCSKALLLVTRDMEAMHLYDRPHTHSIQALAYPRTQLHNKLDTRNGQRISS